MGIPGLLQMLKGSMRKCHLKGYRGMRVGIDGYVWLHRGTYCCAYELCQSVSTTGYLKYCLKMINLVKNYGIIPVMVFDGNRLPSKGKTEVERNRRRTSNRNKGISLLRIGRRGDAVEFFKKAVDVSTTMAYHLINLCKVHNVEYVVAPFEADAQLAYLWKTGFVDLVLTEDSDLIPYGCGRVLFKCDNEGFCDEFCLQETLNSKEEYNFRGFTSSMILNFCIFAGCDYLDSLKGVGIKTSYKYFKKYKTVEKVLGMLRRDKSTEVPKSYLRRFKAAELTFKHHFVWDPEGERITHLSALPNQLVGKNLSFLGVRMDDELAMSVCGNGDYDPISKEKFNVPLLNYGGIYSSSSSRPTLVQKNTLLNYVQKKKKKKIEKVKVKKKEKKKKKKKKKRIVKSKFFLSDGEKKKIETNYSTKNSLEEEEESRRNSLEVFVSKSVLSRKRHSQLSKRRRRDYEEEEEEEESKNDIKNFNYSEFNKVSPMSFHTKKAIGGAETLVLEKPRVSKVVKIKSSNFYDGFHAISPYKSPKKIEIVNISDDEGEDREDNFDFLQRFGVLLDPYSSSSTEDSQNYLEEVPEFVRNEEEELDFGDERIPFMKKSRNNIALNNPKGKKKEEKTLSLNKRKRKRSEKSQKITNYFKKVKLPNEEQKIFDSQTIVISDDDEEESGRKRTLRSDFFIGR